MGGSPGDVSEKPVTYKKRKKGWRMSCDVGEATIFPRLLHELVNYSDFSGCKVEYSLANVAINRQIRHHN